MAKMAEIDLLIRRGRMLEEFLVHPNPPESVLAAQQRSVHPWLSRARAYLDETVPGFSESSVKEERLRCPVSHIDMKDAVASTMQSFELLEIMGIKYINEK